MSVLNFILGMFEYLVFIIKTTLHMASTFNFSLICIIEAQESILSLINPNQFGFPCETPNLGKKFCHYIYSKQNWCFVSQTSRAEKF
jgi:hypothetical protein